MAHSNSPPDVILISSSSDEDTPKGATASKKSVSERDCQLSFHKFKFNSTTIKKEKEEERKYVMNVQELWDDELECKYITTFFLGRALSTTVN